MRVNMSEDDTFMKLKKINSFQLEFIINELPQAEFDLIATNDDAKKDFLNRHGWTVKEFQDYSLKKYAR